MLLFILPVTAFCWGVTGHRVVAGIAEAHLSSKAKKELYRLMGKENLVQWANWPDFIKSDSTHTWDMASKWHYVNLPAGLADKTAFMQSLTNQTGENLYTQIRFMQSRLSDKSLSKTDRQVALRFLVHLVGDLHQPLHVGRAEDLGGNRISVTWFDKPTNLHAIWDNTLVDFQQYSYSEYVRILNIADKNMVSGWESGTLEDWFYESYQLANKIYSSVPADGKLGYPYNYLFKDDLDNQLLKAGIRLAKLINEALK